MMGHLPLITAAAVILDELAEVADAQNFRI
jgi:hypothetical protein